MNGDLIELFKLFFYIICGLGCLAGIAFFYLVYLAIKE